MLGWGQKRKRQRDADAAEAARLGPVTGLEPPIFSQAPVPAYGKRLQPIIWVPGNPPPLASLTTLAAETWALCPPYTRFAAQPGDPTVEMPGIALARLPPGAVLFGAAHATIAVGEHYLADQIPAGLGEEPVALDAVAPFDLPVREIAGEALLIARFGAGRPLCWIGELLPKLALAERAYPGRFTYIVPDPALLPIVADSLPLCGLAEERIFVSQPGLNLRFDSLFAIEPVWAPVGQATAIHPEAAAALRALAKGIPAAIRPRIALTQADDAVLPDALAAVLEQHGFALLPQARLPFAHRLAAAKGANLVFVAAGTDPSSLAFAPRGVHVVASALPPADLAVLTGLVAERAGRLTALDGTADSEAVAAALSQP